MRNLLIIAAILASTILSSCAAAWQGVTYTDDLYTIHNKTAIAERQKAEAELAKAQYEAQQAQYEAALAQIKAGAAAQSYTATENSVVNGYDAVLADSYESAYARRLYGFSSPTYRMPSSYYTWRYSDAFQYASAYDPAFYNVMVSGDMVWVEPKYITSMFGSWGAVAVPSYSWYYGWGAPYYYWNTPYYRWSCNWHWGCSHSHYWAHHHHHYRPHKPSYRRPPQHQPPHPGSGSVGNTGHHHNRPGMVVGRNPVASTPADRGGSVRPSQPSTGRTSTPSYRSGSSSSSKPQYSNGSSSYRSGSSSSSSSYRSSNSSSSSRGSSYSGGGGSHSSGSSHSGGGNSRGR